MEQRAAGVRRPPEALLEVARRALREDLGRGDVTSQAAIPPDLRARGRFVARRELVVSGLGAAAAVTRGALTRFAGSRLRICCASCSLIANGTTATILG